MWLWRMTPYIYAFQPRPSYEEPDQEITELFKHFADACVKTKKSFQKEWELQRYIHKHLFEPLVNSKLVKLNSAFL